MTSWSRRLSNAETRQARHGGPGVDDDDAGEVVTHGRRHDDGPIDEGPFLPDTGSRNRAEDGLTGEQVRTILTDTLVETPDMVAIFASVGREALWANDAFVTLIPIREVDKIWLVELLDEWSKGHYEVKVLPALVKFGRWRGRLTFVSDDGLVPVSAVIVAHRDRHGEIATVSLVARDLSELRSAQEHVSAAERRFAALVEHVADLIAVADPDGTLQYLSPAATRILGLRRGRARRAQPARARAPRRRPGRPADPGQARRAGHRPAGRAPAAHQRPGRGATSRSIVTDLSDNPAIGGIVLNARDVTERVEAARALANRAFSDALTGLPNRVRLLDRLASALADPTWAPVAAMVCDIDQFKPLNAVAGREAGDELLRTVANRLHDTLGDRYPVARLGGDAFAVILAGVPVRRGPGPVGRGAAGRRPADPARRPHHRAEPERRHRDGRHRRRTRDAGPRRRAGDGPGQAERRRSHRGVRSRDGGRHHAGARTCRTSSATRCSTTACGCTSSPSSTSSASEAVGAEALLRVHDDEGGLLSPAEFVEAAESSGLISRLGLQVLQITAEQLAIWSADDEADVAEGAVGQHLTPSAGRPRAARGRSSRCSPTRASNRAGSGWRSPRASSSAPSPRSTPASRYLRSLGVRIGLDDFGTGQSSLGYLKRFPLDFVKIDRSLVAGIGLDEHDTAIVRATIELAHNLGLTVTAVGVETEEQLEALGILGCDRAQGYLFAPALPADQLLTRLRQLPS